MTNDKRSGWRSCRTVPWILVTLLSGLPAAAQTPPPRVSFELLTEDGFSARGSHEWMAFLKDFGLSGIRVRTAQPGDAIEVQKRGTDAAPAFHVIGVLTARGALRLPGGEFRLGDKDGLSKWLAKLQEGGEEGLHEQPGEFGLTAKQLVAVHDALAVPVTVRTRGQKTYDVLRQIAGAVSLGFVSEPQVRQVMGGEEVVLDELQGLSAGTALAAALRPLGLVLVPQKQAGGQLKLWIADVRQTPASWPVGWPPQKPPRETLPDLFTFLNVEIADTPLLEALEAVRERLKVPLLFDYNALARQRIDLAQVKVSLPSGRTYYQRILDRVLNQAKLKGELRLDEAGHPFFWISTLKQ